MQRQITTLLMAAFAVSTTCYAAEVAIKPGLWEITTTSQLIGLASQLPPEQMQGIQDLAKEYGLEVPEIKNGAATSTTCVTPEKAKQNIVPSTFDNDAGCTVSNIKRSGNTYEMSYVCKNPQMEGNGVAQGTLTDPTHFSGQTTFKGTVQGNPIHDQAHIQGKWLSANCRVN